MATYIIGDVQGCIEPLLSLIEKIKFDQQHDALWFTGDLVNRGPGSLEVLRFIKNIKNSIVVLGNHDLYLLAVYYAGLQLNENVSLNAILNAFDKEELMEWLRHQPLLYYDPHLNVALVHAGLPPQWSINQALRYAKELENVLRGPKCADFLKILFKNFMVQKWDSLHVQTRLSFIANALTRIRFCNEQGILDLENKGKHPTPGFLPWFKIKERKSRSVKIFFGHWAALRGNTGVTNAIGLDTGCVWGHCLTAMRLEDGKKFSVQCAVK